MSVGARVPPLVTLDIWGVGPALVPHALLRMVLDRRPLRRTAGLRFAKLLGTGSGRTFRVGDADPLHWGLLAAWDSVEAAAAFQAGTTARTWRRLARERLLVSLRPLSSRGCWSGTAPFGTWPIGGDEPVRYDGPVAALTRARIAPTKSLTFWRAVPAVSADLHRSPGLRFAVGIGESPVGLQGTFSLWDSPRALEQFAYRGRAHVAVVRRTPQVRWYSEQLFARFAVLSVEGTFGGITP